MPSPVENLFLVLYKRQFGEVFSLIQADPELINAVNPKNGCSLLMDAINIGNKNLDFTRTILTHPKLNLHYRNTELEKTNIDVIISTFRLDILEIVIKDPRILINENRLTYQSAIIKLADAITILEIDERKDPNSKSTARSKEKIIILEQMISMLRDVTILHALATDNATLLDRLEKAGDDPTERLGKLGDEKLPSHLIKTSNTNVKAWFMTRLDQSLKAMSSNPHSFHNKAKEVDRIQAKLDELAVQHQAKQTAVLERAMQARGERYERAMASISLNS